MAQHRSRVRMVGRRRSWFVRGGALLLAACTVSTGPPAATKLAFTVQPSSAAAGDVISPPVLVAIEDVSGNRVTSATNAVTVALGANPGKATLGGTTTTNAVNGIATFANLSIQNVSAGYTLTASSGTLLDATSVPFAIAPALPVIAFHSSLGIEEIHPDGSGRTVLMADPAASDPAWSPDGARLAFTRTSADFQTCDIYTARADGSGAQRVTSTVPSFPCAHRPSWSPDGTKIAFAVDAWSIPPGGRIKVMNADGSNVMQIYADSNGLLDYPTWSPDGTKLAFDDLEAACGEICQFVFVVSVDGSSFGGWHGTTGGCESSPAWSPDGTEVAFVGACRDPYTADTLGIWVANADGSGVRNLTDVPCLCDVDPAWSPDGAQLVFSRATGGNPLDLYIMNRDGTGLRQLTSTTDISETRPAWRAAAPVTIAGRSVLPEAILKAGARRGPTP